MGIGLWLNEIDMIIRLKYYHLVFRNNNLDLRFHLIKDKIWIWLLFRLSSLTFKKVSGYFQVGDLFKLHTAFQTRFRRLMLIPSKHWQDHSIFLQRRSFLPPKSERRRTRQKNSSGYIWTIGLIWTKNAPNWEGFEKHDPKPFCR